jgi:SAM-dependent methyltransferase
LNCRFCNAPVKLSLIDLGSAPPSNAYVPREGLAKPEKWFPLKVLVCENCWLVQTGEFSESMSLFDAEYAYFSGFSTSWLAHAQKYVNDVIARFGLNERSNVLEIAANDGYLLQYVMAKGIPCTGIEPTASTAAAARAKGIPIIEEFFGLALGEQLASQGRQADLVVANNVLAHVPGLRDFVAGIAAVLSARGVATFEFPHLAKLIAETQFDTIYHEHFSYLSLTTVNRILAESGLTVFDVEELPTHGGSLRVYAQRTGVGAHPGRASVEGLLQCERSAGISTAKYYTGFQAKADKIKNDLLEFLLRAKKEGETVAAYGAAAKGNTLFNYAGIRPDLVSFVVDKNPAKQGKFLPGSRIPIVDEARLSEAKPDYVVILPWNLRSEIIGQLDYVKDWGGRFVTAIPQLEVA